MPKVLIVEDEQYLAEMYEMKFKQEGYEVVIASDGEEGIKLAQSQTPDYILLDLVMPKMDGYEVLEKLRSNPKTKDTKIYILSNLGQSSEVRRGLNKGADGYLVKANLTPTQVVEYIKMVGEKKHDLPGWAKQPVRKQKAAHASSGNNGPEVLIIEDEEAIIEMYKMRLEKDGYRVEVARNGAWGLKLASERKFDIIIMDMVMPAMNGYEMLSKIKADKNCEDTPIIVLSNSAQENDIAKTKKLGVNSFLLKSQITPAKLAKEVKKLIK